jgi:signal transduction histidine kinase
MLTCHRVYTGKCPSEVEVLYPDISYDVPSKIRSDRSRICQIVGNMLSNSSKFTVSGSIQIIVTVEENEKQQSSDCDGFLLINVQASSFF